MKKIGETIPSVTIVTGDEDHLMKTEMSRTMKKAMQNAEFVEWKNTGHGIQAQRLREFNALVERTILRSSDGDLRNSSLNAAIFLTPSPITAERSDCVPCFIAHPTTADSPTR
jgi:hypothetical protein